MSTAESDQLGNHIGHVKLEPSGTSGRCRPALFLFVLLLLSINTSSQSVSSPAPELSLDEQTRLQQQIANGSVEQKRSALAEIRNLRNPAASRLAIPALSDKNPMVRATAAGSVAFLPSQEAAAALLPLVNDRTEFVRREAAYALGDVRDRSATPRLIQLMNGDKILEVRTAAAVALGKVGDPAALKALLDILKSRPREENEFLRRSAARSVGQIAQIGVTGNPDVLTPQNFLPDKFKDLGASDAIGATSQIFSEAGDVLTNILRSSTESDDTRREAAFALGAIGDKRSLPILETYLSSPDPYLAEICREAILKIERRNRITRPTD